MARLLPGVEELQHRLLLRLGQREEDQMRQLMGEGPAPRCLDIEQLQDPRTGDLGRGHAAQGVEGAVVVLEDLAGVLAQLGQIGGAHVGRKQSNLRPRPGQQLQPRRQRSG